MKLVMSRRPLGQNLMAWMIAILVAAVAATSAQARIEIDVTRGNVEPLKIAVPSFLGDSQLGRQISSVVEADLRRSGLFNPIDPAAHIERITDTNRQPNFSFFFGSSFGSSQILLPGSASPNIEPGLAQCAVISRPSSNRQSARNRL